ncbi:T9SS type B sorting domain-containing protein [Winogradskyella undariae]|uniref:T9SS type B sorting domain-containing protein n=1 Tax=Winogradskyella undariae TaxID=1285465 RepID=UPI0015C6BCFE|nr:T9SS type B sorting domain-containing protein [Winogradskyella undariae]
MSQSYSVSSYQKINDINGDFSGVLNNEDNLGVSIDEIGDLDGNGVNDIAVGAFSDDDGGLNRGAVWILFLDTDDNVISSTKISDTSGNFTGILDNEDRFGGAVSYLGDLNNDGLPELAVGADYDEDGGYWHGAVWILSLNNNGTVNSHSKISDTQGGFDGFINGDAIFGTDIVNIGDLNNDGVQDLAVGSRRDNDGGGNAGALWILFMNTDFTVGSWQKISSTSGGLGISFNFEDYFGGAVANIGDLNGDGVVDLAVGSYRDNDQNTNSGSIYILFMNSNGTVDSYQKISNLSGNFSFNLSQDAFFGESIDGVVDFDGDGKVEIIVGAMKQTNPTLSLQTGGFFLIELNADGTVSEDYFYSYGEHCFTGQLENGDLFGGSVSFLNLDSDNLKIAVGSYRDSENGNRKGAVWIINLGGINIEVSTIDPTICNVSDGEVIISGLNSNVNYTFTYELDSVASSITQVSNNSGELSIENLGAGNYTNISIEEVSSGCTDTLDAIVLTGAELSASIASVNPTSCNSEDGEITISGLSNNESYVVTYDFDSVSTTVALTSNNSGALNIEDLGDGNYTNISIEEVSSGCTDTLDAIVLTGAELSASIASVNPTNCNSEDGEITISGLSNNESYVVTYELDSVATTVALASNNSGALNIEDLGDGNYTNISIEEVSSGCTDTLDAIVLTGAELSASIASVNPTNCNSEDGEITISGLSNNESYVVTYDFDSVSTTVALTSNNSGALNIEDLGDGNYTNISIEEVSSGCTDTLDAIVLTGAELSASIASVNPTSCNSEDGEITISGLSNNESYVVTYELDSVATTVALASNNSGALSIEDLGDGNYTNISIEEVSSSCIIEFSLIALDCESDNQKCFTVKPFFTPNGDGVNDFWFLKPLGQNNICSYKLYLFNRYGKLIKVLTNTDSHWDGRYNGVKMPSNDYWYVVYYNNGDRDLTFKSHFALKY